MNKIFNPIELILQRVVIIGDKLVDRDSYYTPEQASDILGMEISSIDCRVREGYLRRSGTARNIFYKGQHIIDYLDNK